MSRAAELVTLLGRARELTAAYQMGGLGAFEAYRELLTLMFGITVADMSKNGIRVHKSGPKERGVIAPLEGPHVPIGLSNGTFLRFNINLFLGATEKAQGKIVLKVHDETYQHQLDKPGERWLFRYEYEREARSDQHPLAHFHVRADLREEVALLGGKKPLEDVHFPTGRVSVPAIIRLLVEQFGVPSDRSAEVWRPVLAQVESDFHEIAHQPLSGPSG